MVSIRIVVLVVAMNVVMVVILNFLTLISERKNIPGNKSPVRLHMVNHVNRANGSHVLTLHR